MKVQIAIDNYNDLFSDFDIRDYNDRYISSDFLIELRMRTYKMLTPKGIDISLVMPVGERNAGFEAVIAKRLKSFFQTRLERNRKKIKEMLLKALLLEAIGVAFLIVAFFLSKYTLIFFKDFMLIPSWFFVWNGLDTYFEHKKILLKKITYYSAISKSRIKFDNM